MQIKQGEDLNTVFFFFKEMAKDNVITGTAWFLISRYSKTKTFNVFYTYIYSRTISNKAKVIQALTVWHDGENRFFYQNVYILIFKMGKAQRCKENVICINIWPFHPHRRGTMTVYVYWHSFRHNNIKILAMQVILSFIRLTRWSRQIPIFILFRYFSDI